MPTAWAPLPTTRPHRPTVVHSFSTGCVRADQDTGAGRHHPAFRRGDAVHGGGSPCRTIGCLARFCLSMCTVVPRRCDRQAGRLTGLSTPTQRLSTSLCSGCPHPPRMWLRQVCPTPAVRARPGRAHFDAVRAIRVPWNGCLSDPQGSHPGRRRARREQAHLPAEQPPAREDPRLPAAHAHPRGARDPLGAAGQGPPRALGRRALERSCCPRRSACGAVVSSPRRYEVAAGPPGGCSWST